MPFKIDFLQIQIKGLTPSLLKTGSNSALSFFFYELFCDFIRSRHMHNNYNINRNLDQESIGRKTNKYCLICHETIILII